MPLFSVALNRGMFVVVYCYAGKIIKNHQERTDIALLIDWWEHAWTLDYQADKKQYLENIWKIMNWSHINTRWGKNL